jgi:hypothetical protein
MNVYDAVPLGHVGFAFVTVDDVDWWFFFNDQEPGRYVLRFRPMALSYARVESLGDRELAIEVDNSRGTATAIVP